MSDSSRLTVLFGGGEDVTPSCGGSLPTVTLPAAVSSATYNADNQLTNWAGATLSYDANGNLTADGTSTYTWNARGELTTIAAGSTTTAAYGYDPTGLRVAKTVSGATTGFAYNGSTAIQETSGGTTTANSIVGGTDQILSRTDSAGARSYLTDGLDSTLALVDGSGVIETSYAYTPYGATTASGATSTNSVQYAGRENDANGLYYYRARYYNPTYGRFISEDPLGLAAGSNLYRYAADDPVDLNDPSGMILPAIVTYLAAACIGGAALSVVYDVATAVANWFDGLFGAPTFAHRKITLGSALGDAAVGCALGAATAGLGELVGLIRGATAPELPIGEDPAPVGACSFSADTLVSAPAGEEPIASVKPGDSVYGYDVATGKVDKHTVTAVSKHVDPIVEHLKLADGSVETTPNHRFYTTEHGWIAAGTLRAGDHILKQSGSTATVLGFTLSFSPTPMYDLTVSGVHDFYVGSGQWLAHNCLWWARAAYRMHPLGIRNFLSIRLSRQARAGSGGAPETQRAARGAGTTQPPTRVSTRT